MLLYKQANQLYKDKLIQHYKASYFNTVRQANLACFRPSLYTQSLTIPCATFLTITDCYIDYTLLCLRLNSTLRPINNYAICSSYLNHV